MDKEKCYVGDDENKSNLILAYSILVFTFVILILKLFHDENLVKNAIKDIPKCEDYGYKTGTTIIIPTKKKKILKIECE